MSLIEQATAALNRDPAAIRDAGRGLSSAAGPVADQGAQVARTWRGCEPFYVAPESPVLVAALDPVVTDTDVLSDRLDATGGLLSRYADRIEPLLEQARAIVSFVGPVDPETAAANEQRLNAILMELSALDLELAGAIRGLIGGSPLNPVPGRIKIGTGRNNHQDRIRREALLLPNLKLPRFKINSAVAFETHRIGADQNGVSQRPLQSEHTMITLGVNAS